MNSKRLIIYLITLSVMLSSCTDLVIIMTGHKPGEIKDGCVTPEPGTYLHKLSNLMLIMADDYRDIPDSLVKKSMKYVEMLTPRVRTRIDTQISAIDNYPVPVRIYNNERLSKREGQEVILFYHGGGFVWGNIRIYDNLCSKIARSTGAVLVSVEYRLAPQYPFPYGVNDSWSVLKWAAGNIEMYGGDTENITLMGDSAGANISAVLSLMARDSAGPAIENQVLMYPLTMFLDTLTPSRKYFLVDNERDFVLADDFLRRAERSYLQNNEDRTNPYISPHFAKLDSTLPRTLIITAQCDPLRDEAKDFGRLLGEAGNEVVYLEYEGMMHGFVSLYQGMKDGRKAIRQISAFCNN